MKNLAEKLIPLGLTEKEARIYIALLQLGRASAYGIATKADLKKPTTYVILGQLIEKGLVIEVPREKKQLFAPRAPEEFFVQAEAKLNDAKKLLPELSSLYRNINLDKARTMYFEGANGVRQALLYKEKELRGKEIIGFFARGSAASPELMEIYDDWNENMSKHNTKIRGFTVYDKNDKNLMKLLRKYRNSETRIFKFLPPELYHADVSIDASETFVRIQLISATQAVIIESEDFAKMFREIFEMAWKYIPTIPFDEAIKKLDIA